MGLLLVDGEAMLAMVCNAVFSTVARLVKAKLQHCPDTLALLCSNCAGTTNRFQMVLWHINITVEWYRRAQMN
jgi:hypothetical protein